jgi:hypothetical protein
MAKPANALHGDQISGARACVAKGVEHRDAGAQQRRGFGRWEFVWDGGDCLGGGNQVFRVTAVMADAGNFSVLAENEIAAAAGIASETMTAVPSDADALAGFPVRNVSADSVDAAGNFMSGNAWILNAGPMAFFYESVAVADAAGFDFNPYLAADGIGNISFDEFEITAGFADLDSLHFRHSFFLMNSGWWEW